MKRLLIVACALSFLFLFTAIKANRETQHDRGAPGDKRHPLEHQIDRTPSPDLPSKRVRMAKSMRDVIVNPAPSEAEEPCNDNNGDHNHNDVRDRAERKCDPADLANAVTP